MNMNLSVLGINFRTAPIELREQASFVAADVGVALGRLCAEFPGSEAVLLSTCNRTELYTAGIDVEAKQTALIRMLLKGNGSTDLSEATRHFYTKKDLTVAEHLLAVVSGLDSMVVGETEILGQVKQAYMLAEQAQALGKALDPLFQNAFRIAKRIHTETDLCRGRVSVSSIAVEFAEKVFEDLGSKTVMIVGAGETAELSLKSLIERGAKEVLVLNRSLERALSLAERYGGRAIPYDLLDDYLPRADIVISSTSAPHCVIREATVRKAVAVRRGLPLLLIDIAVPRDIEPAAGELANVYLYDIDDLQRVAAENLAKRQESVEEARKIIREGAAEVACMFESADLREMMRRLDEFGQEVSDTVLQRMLAKEKMAALSDEAREEVRAIAQKVVAKLLAGPRESLKRAARNGQWAEYANVVSDLFRFNDRPGADRDNSEAKNDKDSRKRQ
jgi:glutamyl-tRNA reductase